MMIYLPTLCRLILTLVRFNSNKYDFVDRSKSACHARFGKHTYPGSSPAWWPKLKNSTYRDNFKNPKALVPPTFRFQKKDKVSRRELTKLSGFAKNHTMYDGFGTKPHPILNGNH